MSYKKTVVDNVTCSRRFHVAYDDSDPKLASVELKCPYCGVTVFSEKNHPEARMIRQENLVQASELSDNIINECKFRDKFSEKTVKGGESIPPVTPQFK